MKKIILTLSVLSILSILSCRNDNNTQESETSQADLIGKWSFQKVDVVKTSTGQTQTTENSECDQKSIHEFQQTIHQSTFYGIINHVCQLTGEVNSRNYTFDQNAMKFWYEDEQEYPYFVTKLTEDELIFEDRTQDIDDDNKNDIIRRYFRKM